MSKITMQDIADALGISRVTVWKAFNNHSGVSPVLKQGILEKAKELGYTRAGTEPSCYEKERTVSVIVSRPDSSTFWTNIIHRMAQELSCHNVNLLYTYMPSSYDDDFILPSVLTGGAIQGAVILNVYDERIIRLINELELPKVFLDTVPRIGTETLRGDLLLLEGYHSTYKITQSVINRGITELGFIGDIQYARTNLDRYHGFCKCMEDNHLEIKKECCMTRSIHIDSYYQVLSSFLDSLPRLPKAFICASDYITHFLQLYFTEHRNRIPEGILVTGFDGSLEYTNVSEQLTTADVRTSLLGKRLSMQIIYRMEYADAPYELTYINPAIIYRDSMLY